MDTFTTTIWILFGISLLGVALVFLLYPLGLALLYLILGRKESHGEDLPTVTVLVPVRNGERLIADKIENTLAVDYPRDRLDIIVYSDGSTDRTVEIATAYEDRGVRLMSCADHRGKADALNTAVAQCETDLVVFTDADARLVPDAIRKLVRHFGDPRVGGVCGQRAIESRDESLDRPQHSYVSFDSTLKTMESRIGSITSSDGKLYCIRRELFRPVDSAVTDDSFICLNVVHQHHRVLFEPEAIAEIPVPSRSPGHELRRRRRVVARSLRGLFLMRGLFNPFRYGTYSFSLWINKVMRRLLPFGLSVLFVTSGYLALESTWVRAFFFLQVAFLALAILQPVVTRFVSTGPIAKAASLAFYFSLGAWGTALGMLDFLRRKKVTKWDPVKADPAPTT